MAAIYWRNFEQAEAQCRSTVLTAFRNVADKRFAGGAPRRRHFFASATLQSCAEALDEGPAVDRFA